METQEWIALVLSSAFISSLANILWSLLVKYIDKKRKEKERLNQQSRVYLDVAMELERFSKKCYAYIYDIDEALWYRNDRDDGSYIDNLKPIDTIFESEPNWNNLPICFVSAVKPLPHQFSSTYDWIVSYWNDSADMEDTFSLEKERLAFYGLKAIHLAKEIREKISVVEEEMVTYEAHFESIIEERRRQFEEGKDGIPIIPELRAKFKQP